MEKVWGEHEVSNCTCVYVGGDGRVSALLLVRRAVKANYIMDGRGTAYYNMYD